MEQKLTLDMLRQATPVTCECGHEFFEEVVAFRKVSRLLFGGPKDALVPAPYVVCAKCKKVNEELSQGFPQ